MTKTLRVIELTQNYVAIIDSFNFRKVNRYSWHVHFSKGRGRKYGQPYARANIKGKKVYLHQFLKPGEQVDHKNHCTLDCRESNLEPVDHITNQKNRRDRMWSELQQLSRASLLN